MDLSPAVLTHWDLLLAHSFQFQILILAAKIALEHIRFMHRVEPRRKPKPNDLLFFILLHFTSNKIVHLTLHFHSHTIIVPLVCWPRILLMFTHTTITLCHLFTSTLAFSIHLTPIYGIPKHSSRIRIGLFCVLWRPG